MAASPNASAGIDPNRPTVVALLHLLGGLSGGAFGIIAVVLAYVWKGNLQYADWKQSHYRYHIRTFWYSILFTIVGWLTWWVFGLGFLILALIGIAVCCVRFWRCLPHNDTIPYPIPPL